MQSILSLLTLPTGIVQPTVTTQPPTPTPNLVRATSVDQMFDIIIDSPTIDYVYEIGKPAPVTTHSIRIRNRCAENTLALGITLPNFLNIVPFGITLHNDGDATLQSYIIPVGYTFDLVMAMNEAYAQAKSPLTQRQYLSAIRFTVAPLNVIGPVLVQVNTPPLTF